MYGTRSSDPSVMHDLDDVEVLLFLVELVFLELRSILIERSIKGVIDLPKHKH